MRMRWLAVPLLLLAGCGTRTHKPVESLAGGPDVARFTLASLQGTRDGDRLTVRAIYTGGADPLTADLRFAVGPATRLESGTWTGFGAAGTVRERSVTFLGGQSGPPSIGGRFDLIAQDGTARFRINIPLQPLSRPL